MERYAPVTVLLLTFFVLLVPFKTHADWVNMSGAEVAPNIVEFHVEEEGVRVVFEVFVDDLKHFSDLLPAEWLVDNGIVAAPDAERLVRFGEEGLVIRADDGAPLPVQMRLVERRLRVDRASLSAGTVDPYSGRRRPEPPKDPRVLYAELFYDFGGRRPETLEFAPPADVDGNVLPTIGMIVFHREVPVIDFRYLSASAKLMLNWQDPWYSRFDNFNLIRHHRYPRMVFLYAEPYEIRYEALIRVRDIAELADLQPAGANLTTAEAETLIASASQKIAERTQMSIDGAPVRPDFDRAAYMRIGLRGLEILPPGEIVNVEAGILGLIWSVPTDGLPQKAQLEWTWFDENAPEVAGYTIDAAGPFLSPLRPNDPILIWTNHFKKSPYPEISEVVTESLDQAPFLLYVIGGLGTLGLGLMILVLVRRPIGGARVALLGGVVAVAAAASLPIVFAYQATAVSELDDVQLEAMTDALLNNVYRAFDFRLEDQVYDRLALTLEGDILEEVYVAQRDSLRVERAGGADARVEALKVMALEQLSDTESGTLRLRVDWVVRGSVGHWGHIHRRTNAYQADLTVVPIDGSWKIREFNVLSQERLL